MLKALIRLSQHIGRGNSTISFNVLKETFIEEGPNKRTESDHEATGLDDFLSRFHSGFLDDLAGKTILDFGCGYGGKAVELARRLPSAFVIGIEPHQKKIVKAKDFALRQGVGNCEFRLCTQESVPLPDESIDAIVCHDVLEHVHDPAVVLREMHRVLKSKGRGYIVFPPYDGPISHHLDFITSMPGLHWIFSAHTIMTTVNSMLTSEYGKRFKTPPQPPPSHSKYANKWVLPSLNGLGTPGFVALTTGRFQIERMDRITLMDKLPKLGLSPRMALNAKRAALKLFPAAADHLTITMAVVVQKTR